MSRRLKLHEELVTLLGSSNVYFQPPESVKMNYPAIVYELDNIQNTHADDGVYLSRKRYSIVAIDKNPDSSLPDKLAAMPASQFGSHYTSDNLHHWAFSIYY